MRRRIDGFHQDDVGDWVAELSCLHGQHVRHRPPFLERPWILDPAGRRDHIGTEIDCPLCDRAELPTGLRVARTAGPFDRDTLPAGLRRTHRVAARTWAVLRVLHGTVAFELEVEPPSSAELDAGARQAIPPDVAHRVRLLDEAVVEIDFLVADAPVETGQRR